MEADEQALFDYVRSLPPQRLIVRAVDEIRPQRGEQHAVVVGHVRFVEVVTVASGSRVTRTFANVRADVATRLAEEAGHTVIARSGNIT